MFYIKIADIIIAIDNKYEYVKMLCRDYIVPPVDQPHMTVSVSAEEISNEIKIAENPVSAAYAEGVCVYRHICSPLPEKFGAYLMHCAVIEYKGEGYAFAAASGTGKSTHISLWQKRYGDEVRIINGDKPIMRFIGDRLYAYGTPWCGKEGWNRNVRAPLKGLCFLERATENRIDKLPLDEAATRIMKQILIPKDAMGAINTFELVDKMLNTVECWLLGCNISQEAAEIAYNAMSGGQK